MHKWDKQLPISNTAFAGYDYSSYEDYILDDLNTTTSVVRLKKNR